MNNQQLTKCQCIVDHIGVLLSDTENLQLIIKEKVYRQAERYGFCASDILFVLANIDDIEANPPGYGHNNCYLVSGVTIDDVRLKVVLVANQDSMRIRILTVWNE